MKKIILISSLMCFFATAQAQDANRKSKNTVATPQKVNTIPAQGIEATPTMEIDASAMRNGGSAQPATMSMPITTGITIDARQAPIPQEQKNKVQQAPAKK